MPQKRKQLSLFVDAQASEALESIRLKHNPAQHALIRSHVTLCREDELENLEQVLQNLLTLQHPPLEISFGAAQRFADGKGVLLPAIGDLSAFHHLRAIILKGAVNNVRPQEAHLTLMHPRNATCTDEVFREIGMAELPGKIIFRTISLIEQEIGKQWHVLKDFALRERY